MISGRSFGCIGTDSALFLGCVPTAVLLILIVSILVVLGRWTVRRLLVASCKAVASLRLIVCMLVCAISVIPLKVSALLVIVLGWLTLICSALLGSGWHLVI